LFQKIKAKERIQAAYSTSDELKTTQNKGCNGKGCCSFIGGLGGSPWQYSLVDHLGSTVYCVLSLLFLQNENANIYQFLPNTKEKCNQEYYLPNIKQKNKSVFIIILILIISIFCILLYFLLKFAISRKK
jgi:hypothetical protein